jgi:hypothetical protein
MVRRRLPSGVVSGSACVTMLSGRRCRRRRVRGGPPIREESGPSPLPQFADLLVDADDPIVVGLRRAILRSWSMRRTSSAWNG